MSILPGMATLIVIALCFSVWLKKSLAYSLPMAALSMILVSYSLSILGIVNGLTVCVLLVLAASMLIILLCRQRTDRGGERVLVAIGKQLGSPTMLAFIVFAFFLGTFCFQMVAHAWDEFSHWAVTVEDMYYRHRLSTDALSISSYHTYPPAMALWQFIFVVFAPTWSDGICYFAYDLYLLLMLMPLFQYVTWKRIIAIVPLLALVYALPYYLYSYWGAFPWRSLFIDHAMPLTFSFALLSYFGVEKKEARTAANMLQTGLALGVLSLLKSTGIALAGFVLLAIVIDVCFRTKKDETLQEGITLRKRAKSLLWAIIPFVLAFMSWNLYLRLSGVAEVCHTSAITPNAILRLISGQAEEWRYTTVQGFWAKLFTPFNSSQTIANVSYLGIVPLWIILAILAALFKEGSKRENIVRYLRTSVVLSIGYMIYLVSVLITYLYLFSQVEAVGLSSFYRYVGDFLMAITVFWIVLLVRNATANQRVWKAIMGMALAIGFVFVTAPVDRAYIEVADMQKELESQYNRTGFAVYAAMKEKIEEPLTVNDRVYYYYTDNHSQMLIPRKALMPARCGTSPVGGFKGTLTEWQKMLRADGDTHVYIHRFDETFAEKFGAVFPNNTPEEQTLYRIHYIESDNQLGFSLEKIVTLGD